MCVCVCVCYAEGLCVNVARTVQRGKAAADMEDLIRVEIYIRFKMVPKMCQKDDGQSRKSQIH